MLLRRLFPAVALLLVTGCAALPGHLATPPAPKPDWAFQQSDLAPDPAFRFGKLDNGMRFIVRHNAQPAGTVQLRMEIGAGSLDETPAERGFAHYVEHMAFNGSTHVPEGEMVKLLERDGLAFGADTNAQTSFEQTTYQLDLPRADPKLLDTALMLFRETASELKFDSAAVDRERGVVLSEMRDAQGYQFNSLKDQLAFLYPAATYPQRLPIGIASTVGGATADALRTFWRREYVPANATVIVIGDIDADAAEQAIRAHFADWQPAPLVPRPDEGRVEPHRKGATDVWLDPALSERVTASRHGRWLDEPDTAANRRLNLLRAIGYGIVNRRFQRMSRVVDPPFRGAGFGTGAVFKIGRTTNLVIDTVDGKWQRGLSVATLDYARAIRDGFTPAEVAEQVANIRTGLVNAAASADTRSNGALVGAALALLRDDEVPTHPQAALERFTAFEPAITPAAVLAALKSEALPLDHALLRFQGRRAPVGGAKALRSVFDKAARKGGIDTSPAPATAFGYTDFGPPGTVVADTVEPALGIREVRFANGVRLNLKRTALEASRIQVSLALDGGEMLDTRADPLATELVQSLGAGGLGKHSQDELQSLLAGRIVGGDLRVNGDVFSAGAITTPRDLELELQLLAAGISDPGYRPEGEEIYKLNAANFFLRIKSAPGSALGAAIGGILSADDPRFTYQKPSDYQALTFAKLKTVIADRLAHGAIEIGLVGDLDEAQAIALVGRTLGALPPREPDFRAYTAERERGFTPARGLALVRHTGDPHQALIRYVWPTRDDADPVETLALELLEQVTAIEVLDTVREKLGKSYSPGASSAPSHVWRGYGTFSVQATVDVTDIAATHDALDATMAGLVAAPVDADILDRARAPMLERLDNALKSNSGWLSLVSRAQTQADRIDRYRQARARLQAMTPADLQALAKRYLAPGKAVQIVVLPEGAPAPH
ncbi:M16 family metallopeptidase [Novosphingobium lentum]|uniref:M16 family metallopeptidase n=1 Tax=Novosphingobium lentum TaxID=145287 RepID=UPI00082B97CC|nr:M16 family metallopeptidase [Novosphingobium lentum]